MCFCRCACVSGFLKRLCGTVQWTVFAAATAAMFTISVVGDDSNIMTGQSAIVLKIVTGVVQLLVVYKRLRAQCPMKIIKPVLIFSPTALPLM